MPILPSEPDVYPSNLWDSPFEEDTGDFWWCLHTKPRQEKATARYLHNRGIRYYLPLVWHEKNTPAGRKICSQLPLFPGYLFLYGNAEERVAALKGNSLVRVLEVTDQVSLVRDLRQINQMMMSGLTIVPEPSHPVGSLVRITTGPLSGITGTVVRRGQNSRLVAMVKFLGSGATVKLQDWQVEEIVA
jgi:transcription antitermination factor NusG